MNICRTCALDDIRRHACEWLASDPAPRPEEGIYRKALGLPTDSLITLELCTQRVDALADDGMPVKGWRVERRTVFGRRIPISPIYPAAGCVSDFIEIVRRERGETPVIPLDLPEGENS